MFTDIDGTKLLYYDKKYDMKLIKRKDYEVQRLSGEVLCSSPSSEYIKEYWNISVNNYNIWKSITWRI